MASSQQEPAYDPQRTGSWLVCTACGTQFPTADPKAVTTCRICDDPRQFTPRTGQAFTTLDTLRQKHKNTFTPFPSDDRFTSISSEPKFAIGQRAILVKTPHGNVLWDCITVLDDETIKRIKDLGGLKAIVISHPHYYSTHVEWACAFQCPVYLAAEDKEWTVQTSTWQNFITETEFNVPLKGTGSSDGDEVKVLKLGGHFPGSFVTLYDKRLLIADTLVTTPAGLGNWDTDALGEPRPLTDRAARDPPNRRPLGMNSFSFMWSIPNMIPLSADEIAKMWAVLGKHEFRSTHGAFVGVDVEAEVTEMRRRVLESMQIQIRYMGYVEHAMLTEN
ncbi:metallo-beta-lactamase family protein [Microdochium trichocladiopsis]|uniref:Metallo-beta-lactamase family protein n=1 Tax=Microdochium trichocladiopsis TaxID=1682393 RepID=A0A9P8XWB8_9PEZI|nr:metallo-beta-lactamase family protein [Microdochium trichocladiopsis]KAH7018516.1 metallo-beta-lactamase family protein [Microdochium trichocladiopsis]